jgi:hypothetical protein
MAIKHGYTEDIAMSDDELLAEIYGWIAKAEDDTTSDAHYWLITEAFERFAPEAEARQLERDFTTEAGDPKEFDRARAKSASGRVRGWSAICSKTEATSS